MTPISGATCKKCGKPVLHERMEYCMDCTRHKRSFESGMSAFLYQSTIRKSLTAIKYKNKREYLDFYASAMDYRMKKWIQAKGIDLMVPIPIHGSRWRKRGFNQAEELAKRLSKAWNIPMDTKLLKRNKKTMPQKSLSAVQRLANLQQAFELGDRMENLPNRVLLVDDIYTTGSTIESCTRVLLEAGVQEVYFVTIAIGNA